MADYEYLTESGVIVPQTVDIQTGVEAEYTDAFGADLSLAPETPQGVLIAAETVTRAEVVNNNAAVANQINPNIAGGVFLKAICALTGLDIPAATHSIVADVALAGDPATLIPAGSQAYATVGGIDYYFESTGDCTLDVDGNGVVDFQSIDTGPIPCPASQLTHIATEVLGWETVLNPDDAVLGVTEVSDEELRSLRNNTLALQGIGLTEAITSGLYATEGVRSLKFRENTTDAPAVIDGINLVANSVWACVDGGTDEAVAQTLLNTKSLGCAWNGAEEVEVVDASSGQTYTVKFDRPEDIPVGARATIRAPSSAVAPTTQVRQAILDYAAGLISGQTGFVVGGSVSPFELAGAVMTQIPGVFVTKMEVQLMSGGGYFTTSLELDLDQLASIDVGDIVVDVE